MESDISYYFHSYALGMVYSSLLIDYLNSISEVGGTPMVCLHMRSAELLRLTTIDKLV